MAKLERLQPECPPDAHKVMRTPENRLSARLVVRVEDSEAHAHPKEHLCEVLALMSEKPMVWCSDRVRQVIEEHAAQAQIEPAFLNVYPDEHKAALSYADGSVSELRNFYDFTAFDSSFDDFLNLLPEEGFIAVNTLSMLILRSISTVYPWDRPLAEHFLRQYEEARSKLNEHLVAELFKVRYGQLEPEAIAQSDAYPFLRLERKLFLQYPPEDD